MGFRLGDIADVTDAGIIKGIQREIACDCWFTSNGKTIPRLIKVMDESGELHTLTNIELISTDVKNYSGIETIEHICKIRMGEQLKLVKLIFTKKLCKWTIVFI